MIIDGKAIAKQKLEDLRSKIRDLRIRPKLAVVLVGDDPASVLYVNLKKKRAEEIGIKVEVFNSVSVIERLNRDKGISGIIVQLPLPEGIDAKPILAKVDPAKDVDGLTGRGEFLPAAVAGILAVLEAIGFRDRFSGSVATVIGQGQLIGGPLARQLSKMGMTVNRCDEFTPEKDLQGLAKQADLLVSATGVMNLVQADWVKPGAVVIDCGSPQPEVDFEKVKDIASAITPVPGGIGPLTIASLLENVYTSAITHDRRN